MTVSIVVPTFNRAALLPRAIESALVQRDADVEVVVVDDGSTDDTAAVLQRYTDPRVHAYVQRNAGVSAARNAGARFATAKWLLFLDSDDELVPDAVERFLAVADATGALVVLSGYTRVSADGRVRDHCEPEPADAPPRLAGPYLPGAFLLDRELFLALGGYDEQLRYSENSVLGWRIRIETARTNAVVAVTPESLVVRYSQPDRSVDRARYDAAVHILGNYAAVLDDPRTGIQTPRHRWATYEAIAAVHAAALGLRAEAWRHALAAVRREPESLARYRTLFGVARATVRSRKPAQSS